MLRHNTHIYIYIYIFIRYCDHFTLRMYVYIVVSLIYQLIPLFFLRVRLVFIYIIITCYKHHSVPSISFCVACLGCLMLYDSSLFNSLCYLNDQARIKWFTLYVSHILKGVSSQPQPDCMYGKSNRFRTIYCVSSLRSELLNQCMRVKFVLRWKSRRCNINSWSKLYLTFKHHMI